MGYAEYFVWGILTFALILLSVNKNASFIALFLACIGFVYFGVLDVIGVGVLAGFTALMILYYVFGYLWIEVLLVCGCTGLFFHWIAGFYNPKILSNVFVSPQSVAYSLYFNLDKSLIPFVLVIVVPSLFFAKDFEKKSLCFPQILLLICSLILLLFCAMFLDLIQFEFHIPSWILLFFWANLFFVCYVEEAFFRGYFQQRLSTWLGEYPALILSSLLFALYHLKISALLAVFAFFAGIIYGLVWLWSGRVWISTLFHFGFNLSHFLFFTYPFARG